MLFRGEQTLYLPAVRHFVKIKSQVEFSCKFVVPGESNRGGLLRDAQTAYRSVVWNQLRPVSIVSIVVEIIKGSVEKLFLPSSIKRKIKYTFACFVRP
jgi:hypothetical protein